MDRGFELIAVALAVMLIAPSAPAEMYRWVDAQGRVHFSDRPVKGAENVELEAQIQVQEPAEGTSAEAIERARAKRREVQRWANRESRTASRRKSAAAAAGNGTRQRFQQVMPRPGGPGQVLDPDRVEKSRERECLRNFGKPCSEIDNWKKNATDDCRRRNLSQDCESDTYLSKRRPRTVEEQDRIEAKRQKREDRRWKKAEREIDELRRR